MNIKLSNYKLAHVDKNKVKTAAKKALMAANSLYYSWNAEQQEQFRVSMDEKSIVKIQQILLNNILGIKCKLKEVDDIWDDVPLHDLNILNWARLLTSGIGDNFIFLNESMAENTSLLDFPTVYDYNHNDYLYQEKSRKQNSPDYKGMDYFALQHSFWFRLIIDDNFYYATGTSLASYINDELDEFSFDFINHLIPHKFVEGKDNGKKEKGGFLWDMKLDANGLEGQLDELNTRLYSYLNNRWLALSQRFSGLGADVYIKNQNWDDDPHVSFIFTNEKTLKKVHWKHFLSDIEPLITDFSFVEKELESEVELLRSFLSKNYQDILDNFDPKVVKLKKKRKVIMAPGVLDDLDLLE